MILDSLTEQAAATLPVIGWDEATEKKFFDDLNEAAAQHDAAGRQAKQEAMQANEERKFASAARKAMDRAERERAMQWRRFWLLVGISIIAAIFPASHLAVMLGVLSSRAGAMTMCVGLLLMGAMSCMTVQAFWPRKRKAQCI